MDKLVPQKFKLQGHEYLVGRLDLFEAMKLQKRLGPLMPTAFNNVLYGMWTAYGKSMPESKATLSDKLTEFGTLLAVCQPLLDCGHAGCGFRLLRAHRAERGGASL